MRRRSPRAAAVVIAFGLLGSCVGSQVPGDEPLPGDESYAPAFASTPTAGARGTLAGDYAWARQAATEAEAVARWSVFLSEHQSSIDEYEDGFHANHVSAAKYELVRLFYLTGETEAGDSLLREISGL